ncbi:putative coatomer protein complex, subunit alpha, partial [Toxoplasma gondii TgCatPRC2]
NLLLCTVTLNRLVPGTATTRCPFCNATAKVEFSGRLCPVCELSELGARVVGLQFQAAA